MPTHAIVDVKCPHCLQTFIENATLVRRGGSAYCPDCETQFELDETDPSLRQALLQAKAARQRRKERVRDLRQRWAEPQPRPVESQPTVSRPVLLSDVLKALDQLLDNLNGIGRKAS